MSHPWTPSGPPGSPQDAADKEAGKGRYWPYGVGNYGPPAGGGGGGGAPSTPAPRPAPAPKPGQKQTSQVKVSNVNVVAMNYNQQPVELLEKMFFQEVGGTEILSVARHDTVGGEPVIYSEVDNLKDLQIQFNPLNILTTTNINNLFKGYGIDITQKLNRDLDTVRVDVVSGNMEIEVVNVNRDEYVQIQVASRVEEFPVGDDTTKGGLLWYNIREEK
jgi:hypothetical protein